jgi:hypothetical protein
MLQVEQIGGQTRRGEEGVLCAEAGKEGVEGNFGLQ